MKDWVIRTLNICRPEWVSKQSWQEEINNVVFAWRRLAELLNISWADQRFTEIFGSCLAMLSEEDFLELFKMRNLFFLLPEKLGQVHGFSKGSNSAVVVIFSPNILLLSDLQIRGIIGHELAHIFEGHYEVSEWRSSKELEKAADERAISLGFSYEIQKLREK